MGIPVSSLEVGKCYLTSTGRVWRIMRIIPDGQVLFEHRSGYTQARVWMAGKVDRSSAKKLIQREVPCDWTPETDE